MRINNQINIAGLFAAVMALLPATTQALECQPIASLNYNLTEQWNHIPSNKPPYLFSVKKVEQRQNFNVYMILRQVAVTGGNCKVTADVKITRPDGKLCFDNKDIVLLSGPVPPGPANNAFLSPQFVKVCLENSDPLGQYNIKLNVTDQTSKQTAVAETTIELVSSPEYFLAIDFADPKAQQIVTFYYLQPQPEKLIPLYLGYCKQYCETLNKDKSHNPLTVLAFFYKAFDLNRQLLPQLAVASKELDPTSKNFTIMLFHYLKVEDQKLYNEIGKAQSTGFRKILAEQPNPFEFEFPVMPLQLDILWSEFFATGSYQPVKMIAVAMAELQRGISPEQFKALKKPTSADQVKLSHWLVGYAARWSLEANAKQHPLVKYYAQNVLDRDTQDAVVKKQLQEIIAAADAKTTATAK